jgi:hypothetical protein
MTVKVATGVIHLPNGARVEVVADNALALDAADAAVARVDLVYVNSLGAVSYLAGALTGIKGKRTYTVTTNFTGAVAGQRGYIVTTNFALGDVVTFEGQTFTGVDTTNGANQFIVGATSTESYYNLASAMCINSVIAAVYSVEAGFTEITVTEKAIGGGDTPGAMTVGAGGTGVISAGTPTTSVSGDVITICGITLTAITGEVETGEEDTQFVVVSGNINTTVLNIKNALGANTAINSIYTVTNSTNTFTIEESIAGGGHNPTTAVVTGTGVISNGNLTSSVSTSVPDTPEGGYALANIAVVANETTIAAGDITDKRIFLQSYETLSNYYFVSTTAARPTTGNAAGRHGYDTTLDQPIWRNAANSGWVDATGTTV